MPGTINFFDTYTLIALAEEIVPTASFFRDRYFPTEASDIFACDKVLTEYKKGDRKMACYVSPRVGDIPVERLGFTVEEYEPAYIAPSRILTLDDLKKRGFGEAFYPGQTPAQRAAQLQLKDLTDLDERIARREEWMAVQTMINNACEIQEYIDEKTTGDKRYVQFHDGKAGEHKYTVQNTWNSANGDFFGDVKNMCRMLSKRGLRAADLVLGTNVADAILNIETVQKLLDNKGVIIGQIEQEMAPYDGVVYMGTLNFGGFKLNLISVDESYIDENDVEQKYFPATSAMVTAPACGHMMYGQVTQIDLGNTDYTTYAAARVPKFHVDGDKDIRKLRLACRPLAAPKNYCPYIYAENVIG